MIRDLLSALPLALLLGLPLALERTAAAASFYGFGTNTDAVGVSDDGRVAAGNLYGLQLPSQDSFRWTGEALDTDGKSWKLQGDFRATRRR